MRWMADLNYVDTILQTLRNQLIFELPMGRTTRISRSENLL
jgi:hypothetical protein